MYSPDRVFAIDLVLPPASMEALENEPESGEYVEATFSVAATDGIPGGTGEFTVPQKAEVRLKGGQGSFREIGEKAAFKLKFPKTGLFLGLRRMTLNNMVQDSSMLHETLAYELFRGLGVPASRTGYAFLRINGVPYGVYLNLETLDNVSLPQWFESTQHLYEADAPGTDVVSDGADDFEVDEGDDEDLSDLEALIAATNDSEGDWSEGMAPVADLDEMTRMWAVERYVGHWDGYAGVAGPFRPNNYYLHSLDSGVFEMIPWGTDQTWGVPVEFGESAGGLLFSECLADASCTALYGEALGEVAAAVPALDVDTKAVCTAELLAPWQALEDPGRREHDSAEIAAGVSELRSFIAARPAELAAWLGTGPLVPSGGSGRCRPEVPPGPPVQPAGAGPPPLPALSLELRRVRSHRGSIVVRLAASAPGALRLRGWIVPRKEQTRICTTAATVATPGTKVLRCKLPRSIRELRTRRPLNVVLTARLTRSDGSTVSAGTRLSLAPVSPHGKRH
jgi:hypothetical protein